MTALFRALVIDDELLARRRLRQLLATAPDFDVVGECEDARQAANLVQELGPDVVFLDIHMPHVDGFGVQAALRDRVRHIVFVTAYPEHAARAFDVAADDYLVKPVTQARFNDMLDRLRRAGGGGARRVLLGGRLSGAAVDIGDVVWLEANGSYVTVHTTTRTYTLRDSIAHLLTRLGPSEFVRVHRSAALNLAHVRTLRRTARGLIIELSSGARLSASRRRAGALVERLRGAGRTTRNEN